MAKRKKTPSQIDEWKLLASVCRSSFKVFVKNFWDCVPGAGSQLKWNWHLDIMCDELQEIAERVFRGEPRTHDTVINISPGTTKSTVCSILFHPWTWTRMPTARHLSASHTDQLVLDHAAKARDVIRSEKYQRCFPEIALSPEQDTKSYYRNTLGGDRLTCTVAGKSPMGFHSHFATIDDPIDPKKAKSDLEIKTASQFMTEVIPTRKVDKEISVTILVMQRLSLNDPTQVMLDTASREGAVPVRHYRIPATLDYDVQPESLKRYYVDGLMDPVRLTKKTLDGFRATLGPYGYAGQFGQCLVAGTKVLTAVGWKPIENVTTTDSVWTRQGWKRVIWSGQTNVVTSLCSVLFSNGSILVGTPSHPVWTDTRGFVPIDSLQRWDYTAEIVSTEEKSWQDQETKIPKSLYSTDKSIFAREDFLTFAVGSQADTAICTGRCGNFSMVAYPVATTSITKTKIQVTIRSTILNACLSQNTTSDIPLQDRVESFLNQSVTSLKSGISLMTVRNITKNMAEILCGRDGKRQSTKNTNVVAVVELSDLDKWSNQNLCTVLHTAETRIESVDTTRFVDSVGKSTSRQNLGPNTVLENVPLNGVPVYDLTVEDAHEFFADGILVHNSPIPAEGGMFKPQYFLQRVRAAPYDAKRIRYFDRASTDKGGCATAGVLMAMDSQKRIYIEHVVWGQWEPDERNARMLAAAQRDRSRYGPDYEPTIVTEAEGGSSGKDAFKGIAKTLIGFRLRHDRVTGKKEVRAEPWANYCASMNVYLVDNGESDGSGRSDWDIQGYIDEHCAFPFNDLKDRVDASSGAFNILANTKTAQGIRIYHARSQTKKTEIRVVVCSAAELREMIIEDPSLLVSISSTSDQTPQHGLSRLVDFLILPVNDVDAAERQDRWEEPVPPWNLPPAQLLMTPESGKKLWGFLLKTRQINPTVIVVQDDGGTDRRAQSIAYAIVDVLRGGRKLIYRPTGVDNKDDGPAPNQTIYACVKKGRSMVAI